MIVRIHWEFTINAFQNTWKIILVSHTRHLFRSTKVNYFIGQLWQLLTASNVGARTQAWQAKWAVFKIPGFVCKRFLPFFPTPSPLFYLCHPFFARSLTLVPRSLFLNRTETLATQAKKCQDFYHCGRCLHHHNSRGFHVRFYSVKQCLTPTTYFFMF